jgi:quercetin dioxygenase-like cupin family protein
MEPELSEGETTMPFIDGTQISAGLLIGPEHGAQRIFRTRERFAAGFFVGLHTHRGDESFQVIEGTVRFTAGEEQHACGPGEIVFVPAGVEHGFLVLTDACIEVFSEQRMGLFVTVIGPDGSRHVEEIFMEGFPSSRPAPAGQPYTPRQRIRELYSTTRHLL